MQPMKQLFEVYLKDETLPVYSVVSAFGRATYIIKKPSIIDAISEHFDGVEVTAEFSFVESSEQKNMHSVIGTLSVKINGFIEEFNFYLSHYKEVYLMRSLNRVNGERSCFFFNNKKETIAGGTEKIVDLIVSTYKQTFELYDDNNSK